jgi:putative transcriptional regulator
VKAVFVELPAFERYRSDYLDDAAFAQLQAVLMRNPTAGDIIKDTGGLRKLRFADARRSKAQTRQTSGDLILVERRVSVLAFHLVRQGRSGGPDAATTQGAQGDDQGGAGSKEEYMTTTRKVKPSRGAKRDLFTELKEGMSALAEARKGKRTLLTHAVKFKPVPEMTPQAVIRVRKQLRISRALFAAYLRTNVRTLENWEQGRAKPNAQAALLINLVKRFPDTVQRLAAI